MRDSGSSIEKAAKAAGVTKPTGQRWIDKRDGIVRRSPTRGRVNSGRFLSLADREEIAIGLEAHLSLRQIGDRIGRHKSVVKREIDRNRNRDGSYRGYSAQQRADVRARRPKPAKLVVNVELRNQVIAWLTDKWSPQQISAMLTVRFPFRPEMRVSHETIYQAVYVQSKGALKKEVLQALRTGRAHRKSHGRVPSSVHYIPDKILIADRPASIEDRAVPGHWEGDLIMGKNNKSAIGTLVERQSRYVMLLHLPGVRDLTGVRDAMIETILTLPDVMRKTVTWDQGMEMRRHADITLATGVDIYFCDPHSPWQRGTNENTNGLLRQYFPKGTDLSVHGPEHLQFVAAQLNDRPRQTLGWKTPAQVFNETVVASTS
ncbi:IS30 family transposase [Rhodococcus sp. NPDC059969]|uniref:IS30 family transposase n=1 Tax=Rhodococcus sp. NPDC059969 TaxID=3347018 RepID=UPI0036729828